MSAKRTKREKSGRTPTTKTIGRRLAQVRKLRGISQNELSRRTGIAQNVISEYESGRVRMNGTVIVSFAVALDVSADEMLGIKDVKNRATPTPISRKVQRRAEQLEALPPSIQKHILRTIDVLLKGAEQERS